MSALARLLGMLWMVAGSAALSTAMAQPENPPADILQHWLSLASSPAPEVPQIMPSGQGQDGAEATTQPAPAKLPCGPVLVWDDGPVVRCANDSCWLRFGGRVMGDFGWIGGHGLGNQIGADLDDRDEWRQLRANMRGSAFEVLDFRLEGNFAPPNIVLDDAYLRLNSIPLIGSATVGHFKEPFSLEELVSIADITFLERALPNALVPGRNWGVMLSNSAFGDMATWSAGAFKNTEQTYSGSPGQGEACAFTARGTCLAWYEDDGSKLFHIGGDYSYRRPEDPIKFSSRPEAHFVPDFTDTKSIGADHLNLFGSELAWVSGPLSLQGEYIGALTDTSTLGSEWFSGAYAQASYFLTGEHRPYDRKRGVFTNVVPNKDFLSPGRGCGAWELAARYSFLDLEKAGLPSSARDVQDMTFSLNWYLTVNLRVSWNYIRSWVEGLGVSGAADIFAMRLQVNF